MNTNIVIRSILIGFLVAVPSPFIISWLSSAFNATGNAVVFATIYLLAFIGCLVMGYCGQREPRSVADGEDDVLADEDDDREAGVVKWFNRSKGFGFITRDTGEDVFVHYRSIRGSGRRSLNDGQKVRFSVSVGEKGLQADEVSVSR